MKDKVFNKLYESFVEDVKSINEKFKDIDTKVENSYEYYSNEIKDCNKNIIEKNQFQILNDPVFLNLYMIKNLKNVDILEAINNHLDMLAFFKYIYILTIIVEADDSDLLNCVKVIDKLEEDKDTYQQYLDNINNENILKLFDLITNMNVELLKKKKIEEKEETEEKEDEETEERELPEMPNLPFMKDDDGLIPNLAKEISSEIDISNIKAESPEDIMNLLNFSSSNNVLGDVVKKVSTKVNEKIASGELDQQALFAEAMKMMGNMNLGGQSPMPSGGGSGDMFSQMSSMMNNPMVQQMISNMGGGGMPNMGGGGKVKRKVDKSKLSKMSARERLRKKLEEKKKNQQKD